MTITVNKDQRMVVLTGAGISQESGIPTFRDQDGLWEGYDVDSVATIQGWHRNPSLVWKFTSERRQAGAASKPNPAHIELARIQNLMGNRFTLVTQNIDNLHEAAGSSAIHMHGELYKSRCSKAEAPSFKGSTEFCGVREDPKTYIDTLPRCEGCGALIRPHICWFGEIPYQMYEIESVLPAADLFVTVGSSGSVYPAAGLVSAVKSLRGDHVRTVYVGLERPSNASAFDEIVLGKAGEALPGLFQVE